MVRRAAKRNASRRAGRAAVALLVIGLKAIACANSARPQAPGPTEYQLKAAFLFNFAKFVDWPAGSFASAEAPFSICIVGSDPFGRTIDDSLRDKTIGNRHVILERARDASDARHCQVVFVSAAEKQRVAEILETLRGTSALIVGESDGFAAAGGTIQFAIEDNRVRFLINTDAAERAGLKMSSKLLALATIVHDGRS